MFDQFCIYKINVFSESSFSFPVARRSVDRDSVAEFNYLTRRVFKEEDMKHRLYDALALWDRTGEKSRGK